MARNILTAVLGALAATAATAPADAAQRMTPEMRLERALQGRVAGEPVNCINLRSVTSSQVIDRTAILYRVGSTIYVNRPRAGAESLSNWDAQLQRPFNNRLCSIDTVTMIDPVNGFYRGNVFLGEFVPYRRVRD